MADLWERVSRRLHPDLWEKIDRWKDDDDWNGGTALNATHRCKEEADEIIAMVAPEARQAGIEACREAAVRECERVAEQLRLAPYNEVGRYGATQARGAKLAAAALKSMEVK